LSHPRLETLAAKRILEKSRQNSDGPREWPPADIEIPLADESLHAKYLMGDEVSLRRIAQLANSRVAARIDFPRFGLKPADEDKKRDKNDRVLQERENAAAEQLAKYDNAGIHVLPKVLQMWSGERSEQKLVEGLSVEDAYIMRVLLSVAKLHESKQAHIDSLQAFVMTDAEDTTLNGTYQLCGFENLHPMYKNTHGTVLIFDSKNWKLRRAHDRSGGVDSEGEGHTVATKAKGFMPPLGPWDTDGKPILSLPIERKSREHTCDDAEKKRVFTSTPFTPREVSIEALRRLYAWPGDKTCVDDAVHMLKNMGFQVSKTLHSINMVGVNVGDIIEHLTDEDSSGEDEENPSISDHDDEGVSLE